MSNHPYTFTLPRTNSRNQIWRQGAGKFNCLLFRCAQDTGIIVVFFLLLLGFKSKGNPMDFHRFGASNVKGNLRSFAVSPPFRGVLFFL